MAILSICLDIFSEERVTNVSNQVVSSTSKSFQIHLNLVAI